ncbi:MAG: penicillin-binding protein activator LpoB [Treponema sp.]|nr:penicillin-binding protein activator LpoB [Treponema sp.]
MRKSLVVFSCVALVAALVSACSSSPKVTRVGTDTAIDLTGRWNDTDARMVAESLINNSLTSPRLAQFIQQYTAQNNGRLPAVLVGSFRNESSEHIDTAIISRMMESAIFNSGKMDFVAGGATRVELRAERQDQQVFASEATASALANETGAVLLLTGSINSIVEQSGNTTVRSYFINAEMTHLERNTRIWIGENRDIRKVITQPRRRS